MQRDISGFDNLVQEGRKFIRQGCLQKYSRKGLQQRMFFLVSLQRGGSIFPFFFFFHLFQFSDILLYTYHTQQPTQCFRVHDQLLLKGMKIRDSDNKTGSEFAFIIDAQGNQWVIPLCWTVVHRSSKLLDVTRC